MKLRILFVLLLIVFTAFTSAQRQQRCPGQPRPSRCTGARDVGRSRLGLRSCRARNMWYYDAAARRCIEMRYLGCGGNRNRWCTQASCERSCRR